MRRKLGVVGRMKRTQGIQQGNRRFSFKRQLAEDLIRHEGERLSAYQDSLGYWTIGVGRLIDARKGGGISEKESRCLLKHDIADVIRDLDSRKLIWKELPRDARLVIANLAFNLGVPGLLRFKKMWAALEAGNYVTASKEMRNSVWYTQVKGRGKELADRMERV